MTLETLFKQYELKSLSQVGGKFHAAIRENPLTICSGNSPNEALLGAVVAYERLRFPKRTLRWNEWVGMWEMDVPGADSLHGLDLAEMDKMTKGDGLSTSELIDCLYNEAELPVFVGGKRVVGVRVVGGTLELETK